MTYAAAVEFLYGLQLFGANFGLENTRRLAALAGDPHNKLKFIHVAGTNGKGSTCAMLESIYRRSGRRVGLFTSPHLNSFRERMQINRELISEDDVARLLTEIQPLLSQFPPDHHPTFFEVLTIVGLKYFAEQQCDLVIWETGLGGRLDSTNIVTPLASVITNIAFDHQQWLGDTLGKIAAEKAGIIKPGIPIITTATGEETLEVITRVAHEKNAPLKIVSVRDVPHLLKDIPLISLAGEHQRNNAALSIAVTQCLQGQLPVSETNITEAMATVYWPGRLQQITLPSGQRVLLDGAHNEAGAEALREALLKQTGLPDRTLILGALQDKDWTTICKILAPLANRIFTAGVNSNRTSSPEALAEICRAANPQAEVQAHAHFTSAFQAAPKNELVVITGSLYLIGEAMEVLGIAANLPQERALNEWSPGSATRQ
jgi:dihydrofolate synthase/folylpolyglutamate synthase